MRPCLGLAIPTVSRVAIALPIENKRAIQSTLGNQKSAQDLIFSGEDHDVVAVGEHYHIVTAELLGSGPITNGCDLHAELPHPSRHAKAENDGLERVRTRGPQQDGSPPIQNILES